MKTSLALLAVSAGVVTAQSSLYGQCGGIGWTGATTCVSGSVCTVLNSYYSQCLPGSASSTLTTVKTSTMSTTSSKTSTTSTTSTTTSKAGSSTTTSTTSSASASATGKVKFAGVNISGFDFGCTTDGTCNISQVYPPLSALGGPDGAGQMSHFVNNDHLNIFRLPVGWQYLVNNNLGGTLDSTNAGNYDKLVQACLATGASCIIDIHNYARWDGGIIGQGGPTNAQFTSLWSQLATKYASQSKVIFGVMNEPHDLPSITTWAATVQAAVTAIRSAGATSQMILLPGNDYTSAGQFITDGSGPALLSVKNLDGSTTNLVFDVHKYLDSDNSGTSTTCVTNNIDSAFAPLATWLRTNGRQALNSETGGGNTASCIQYLCQELAYMNANSDVLLGWIGWAAGSFSPTTYALTETPTENNGVWTDQSLVSSCIVAEFQ